MTLSSNQDTGDVTPPPSQDPKADYITFTPYDDYTRDITPGEPFITDWTTPEAVSGDRNLSTISTTTSRPDRTAPQITITTFGPFSTTYEPLVTKVCHIYIYIHIMNTTCSSHSVISAAIFICKGKKLLRDFSGNNWFGFLSFSFASQSRDFICQIFEISKEVMPQSMIDTLSELCSPFLKGGNSVFIAARVSGPFPKTEYRSLE